MKRGLRNNNPLNIRHSADRWQGARIVQTDKAFVQFQSMAYGYRAAWKILDTYCLTFKKEGKAYNVRNIIGRWAPPTENDTNAYIRAVVKLSGLGGNENMPRPKHYWNFDEVNKLICLIAAMTCVENGIGMEQVDKKAICEGYELAFPSAPRVILSEAKNLDAQSERTQILRNAQDDKKMDDEVAQTGPHWDEYWNWSPLAFGEQT